jgi:hypothetical protein
MFTPWYSAGLETCIVGATMIMVNVVAVIQDQEVWLSFLVLDLLILITTIDQIYNKLTVALNILLLLTISGDFSHVEDAKMGNLGWVPLLMRLHLYMSVKFLIKQTKLLVGKHIL